MARARAWPGGPSCRVSGVGASAVAAALATLLGLAAAAAEEPCGPARHDVPSLRNADIEKLSGHAIERGRSYRVRDVAIVRQPIFATDREEEDNRLFRAANRYHVHTREGVIADVILFRAGERTTGRILEESERTLRAKSYLYDARVLVNRVCADAIEVVVVTRDVWTLAPQIGFSRTGGEQRLEFGLSDGNVAGTGSELAASWFDDLDRSGIAFNYLDPNIGHGRTQLAATVLDNDDGGRWALDLSRPFFSLDTRRAWAVRMDRRESEQGLYLLDRKYAVLEARTRSFEISRGFSRGLVGGSATRWSYGYRHEDRELRQLRGAPLGTRDRTLGYPWIAYERVEDDFAKSRNVDRLQSTEDVYLGRRFSVLVGYSDAALGGDDTRRLVLNARFQDGVRSGADGHLALFGASLEGFADLDGGGVEDFLASAWVRYRYRQTPKLAFHASGTFSHARNLRADRQLLLGGDSGLRGFPNRYQAGERSFVVTFEERYFSDLYLFRILRVGAALFADVGRAWFPGGSDAEPFGVISDVGVGLRFESTRTQRGRVLHLDFAWPMTDGPGIGGPELTLTARQAL